MSAGPIAIKAGFQAIDLPGLRVEGLYTHLATAEERDQSHARQQISRFQTLLAELEATGLRPPLVHAVNTAGLVNFPEAHFDLVRPGIGLYGLPPGPDVLVVPNDEVTPAWADALDLIARDELVTLRSLPGDE